MFAYVYHAKQPDFLTAEEFDYTKFDRVAILKIESEDVHHVLDQTFEKTNHIAHSWLENEEVKKISPRAREAGIRSTSLGDVIGIRGVKYAVAVVGFDVIESK